MNNLIIRTLGSALCLPLVVIGLGLLGANCLQAAETAAGTTAEATADAKKPVREEQMGRYGRLEFGLVMPVPGKNKDFDIVQLPDFTVSGKTGVGFGAALGYQIDPHWAVELGLDHRFFGLKGDFLSAAPASQTQGLFITHYDSYVNSVTAMPKLRMSLQVTDDIKATANLGIGISNNVTGTRENFQPNPGSWTGIYGSGEYWNIYGRSTTSLAWTVGAGGEYRISKQLFVTLDVNYNDLGKATWSPNFIEFNTNRRGRENVSYFLDLATVELRLGLGYRF
ncbi:MAG: outer membrane beta-barrel protein [Alphaproteobacteria bacterium]|nr:outer membrane beta-barrel protein [Alphaproteobacteria bacterium]